MNKRKIYNDPVYGFVSVYDELIYDIIEHPYFQRLRRIRQLGLTDYVYPGALHTRFHHAIGSMHLMSVALQDLRSKNIAINDEEYRGALIAILLHDIGHGPFSHALEHTILKGVRHEDLSLLIMKELNREFNNELETAIQIFTGRYSRPFLHQLVSSQLDIDRLDYLQRDCFFTGVSEGTIGADRIIKMITVVDDELVVEEKGIYSIENFLNARRLMYWQVYLHKTSISAEQMLIQIFRRAKYLAEKGGNLNVTKSLMSFLERDVSFNDFKNNAAHLLNFTRMDDYDVWGAIKIWADSEDRVLSKLSNMLLNRELFKVQLVNDKNELNHDDELKKSVVQSFQIEEEELDYFFIEGSLSNEAYISQGQNINILTKKGEIEDVANASDLPNIKAISKIVKKYYLCCPKKLSL